MSKHAKRITLLVCALVAVICSLVLMSGALYADGEQDRLFRSVKREETSGFLGQTVIELNSAGSTTPQEYVDKIEEARAINEDVRGWITIEDLNIDYPVLYSEDNKAYLRTNIYGEHDTAGCIYLDANYGNPYSPMKLIHGHNMRNGTMFANIPQMLNWLNLDDAPIITYCDDLGLKKFKIFSVFSVDSTKESVIINQYSTLEELEELKEIYVEKSWPEVNDVPTGTELLMLNTCWYGLSGGQHNLHCIVVSARIS